MASLDPADYAHQRRALVALRPVVEDELRRCATNHGPWFMADSVGAWRVLPGLAQRLPTRHQNIICGSCYRTGAELTVVGERSEEHEVRYFGVERRCR